MRTPAEDLIAKWRAEAEKMTTGGSRGATRDHEDEIFAQALTECADELEALLTAAVPQPLSSPMLAEAQRARAERAEAALRAYGQHKPDCEITAGERILDSEGFSLRKRVASDPRPQCTCGFAAVLGSPRTEK